MSHHDKAGRFTSKAKAHTVSKNGERFKVVRQLRRMKAAKKRSARERATEALHDQGRQLQRFALLGALSAPGFINVAEAFAKSELGRSPGFINVAESKRSKDEQVEAALSDAENSSFGVEFDGNGSLAERAEDVAYSLGYEEGRTGRSMTWTKDLLAWAKRKNHRKVREMYDSGLEDGAGG